MSQAVITEYQPSLTEWFVAIGEQELSDSLREEDNRKADRLETLFQSIGLPYERPIELPARDLVENTPKFQEILQAKGDELCALRLVPHIPGFPKLRNRGLALRECYETWFRKQQIDPEQYTVFICPHSETILWSAIFVVQSDAVFGEIVRGLHSQLTHGDTKGKLIQFRCDFRTWQWSVEDAEARQYVEQALTLLTMKDAAQQQTLQRTLGASFAHNVLCGYFEFTVWPDRQLYFIDYNRLLPNHIPTPPALPNDSSDTELHGTVAFPGTVRGKVTRVDASMIGQVDFSEGAILVCENTDVRYVPFMRKAGAIVTSKGGMLSHAAIIARELNKPCIIGVTGALERLQDGQEITVDGETGKIFT